MRIYLPTTSSGLRQLVDDGAISGSVESPLTAFAVTPALREWYVNDAEADAEELEYAALTEAARSSLRLLDSEPGAPRRRVVLAVDVADADVELRDDLERGVVRLAAPVPMAAVASAHVDDADAVPTITSAVESIIAADLGDDGSRERVDDAEGYELSWYANQEIAELLVEL